MAPSDQGSGENPHMHAAAQQRVDATSGDAEHSPNPDAHPHIDTLQGLGLHQRARGRKQVMHAAHASPSRRPPPGGDRRAAAAPCRPKPQIPSPKPQAPSARLSPAAARAARGTQTQPSARCGRTTSARWAGPSACRAAPAQHLAASRPETGYKQRTASCFKHLKSPLSINAQLRNLPAALARFSQQCSSCHAAVEHKRRLDRAGLYLCFNRQLHRNDEHERGL